MQKINPFFWFENKAEEAANFYVSVFSSAPNGSGSVKMVSRYDENSSKASGMPSGTAMVVAFELNGQDFSALNGGAQPWAKPSGMISLVVNCESQDEIDHYWDKLSADGGDAGQCGWINHDKFGVTWQIIPTSLGGLISKSPKAMEAMLKMKKIIIADLEKAANE